MSVSFKFDPKTVDLVNVKTERLVQLQIGILLELEMQEDLSSEGSEFLQNLRTHLDWDESWSGEWVVSVYPVDCAYMSVRGSKEEIKNRCLNSCDWCGEIDSDLLKTDHIGLEWDDSENFYFTPKCKVKNIKRKCEGVADT